MAGTIVLLNELAGLPRPPDRSDSMAGPVALGCYMKIDGPDGYQLRDGRADHYDVEPGTYRVRVRWAYYHSNAVQVEVREGQRHNVTVFPAPGYPLTTLPLIGALPQLAGSAIPGAAIRLKATQP